MHALIISISLFVALEHFAFLVLEMFLWTKKSGRRVFNQSLDEAKKTEVLAANQGLYNGFLASGLLWGVLYPEVKTSYEILLFFFSCVFIAGVYGGFSVKKSIFYIQALPALMGILLLLVL